MACYTPFVHLMCPGCGIPHLLHAETCPTCGRELLDPAKAAEMREYWARIPEPERRKAEEEVARRARDAQRVREFLDRKGRWIHLGAAAALLSILAFATIPAPSDVLKGVLAAMGLAAGAAAGMWLHTREGGALPGMFGLGGGYLLLVVVATLLGLMVQVEGGTLFSLAAFFMLFVGAVSSLVGGIALGMYIEKAYERVTHGTE
jgi:hypothetical protein